MTRGLCCLSLASVEAKMDLSPPLHLIRSVPKTTGFFQQSFFWLSELERYFRVLRRALLHIPDIGTSYGKGG